MANTEPDSDRFLVRLPDLRRRYHGREFMDELSGDGEAYVRAARELVYANRRLGGYGAVLSTLGRYLRRSSGRRLRILDIGSGLGDVPAEIVRWADRRGIDVQVTAVEGHPAIAAAGRAWMDRHLARRLRERIEVVDRNVWNLETIDPRPDAVISCLFLHHIHDDQIVQLLRKMKAWARDGILISDLHRHILAYQGIRVIGAAMRASPIFRHDGPVSIRRGFKRSDLEHLADAAGIDGATVRWHWAFRWTLSNLT